MGAVDPARDIETSSIPSWAWPTSRRSRSALDKAARAAKSGDAKARLELGLLSACNRCSPTASPPGRAGAHRGGDAPPSDLQPAHRKAGALRRQRAGGPRSTSRERLRAALAAAVTRDGETAEVVTFSAQVEMELAELARREERMPFLESLGLDRIGARPPGPRGVPPARPAELLHRRRKGGPRLDHPSRRPGSPGRRRHPLRLRKGLHPGRDGRLRRLRPGTAAGKAPATRASRARKARSTWYRMAT